MADGEPDRPEFNRGSDGRADAAARLLAVLEIDDIRVGDPQRLGGERLIFRRENQRLFIARVQRAFDRIFRIREYRGRPTKVPRLVTVDILPAMLLFRLSLVVAIVALLRVGSGSCG